MTGPERIDLIEKMQNRLEAAVLRLESKLLRSLLTSVGKHYGNPASIIPTIKVFTRENTRPLVEKISSDLLAIGDANAAYYGQIADAQLPAATVEGIMSRMRGRFGLDATGKFTPGGYLDALTADSQISLQVVQTAFKAKVSGQTLAQFTTTISEAVQGAGGSGVLQRHFDTYAYDTYQQSDRAYQVMFADKLELEAFRYAGGTIRDSRPFCRERNGKVYLKSEILGWADLEWAGKKKPHDVFGDAGGHRCRHHWNAVSNSTALRERPDLELVDGKLRIKQ